MSLKQHVEEFMVNFMNSKKYQNYLRKKGVTIGKDCEIYKTASFGSEPYLITIGNHVRINAGVQLITHDGGLWVLRAPESGHSEAFSRADKFGAIVIGNNVHIGTNAIIMPGVHIGKNCIIACGAVVTKDIQDNSVVVGVPAKVIETIDEYAEKNISKVIETKGLIPSEKEKVIKQYHNT